MVQCFADGRGYSALGNYQFTTLHVDADTTGELVDASAIHMSMHTCMDYPDHVVYMYTCRIVFKLAFTIVLNETESLHFQNTNWFGVKMTIHSHPVTIIGKQLLM